MQNSQLSKLSSGSDGHKRFRRKLVALIQQLWRYGVTDASVMARVWGVNQASAQASLIRMVVGKKRPLLTRMVHTDVHSFVYFIPTSELVRIGSAIVGEQVSGCPPHTAPSKSPKKVIHELMSAHAAIEVKTALIKYGLLDKRHIEFGDRLLRYVHYTLGGPVDTDAGIRPDVLLSESGAASDRFAIEMQLSSEGEYRMERRLSVYGQALIDERIKQVFLFSPHRQIVDAYQQRLERYLPRWYYDDYPGHKQWRVDREIEVEIPKRSMFIAHTLTKEMKRYAPIRGESLANELFIDFSD